MLDDLAIFFGDPLWSVEVTRTRSPAADVQFGAIVGERDEPTLDGHALAANRQIAYATGPDVVDGDTLVVVGTGPLSRYSGTYRAREPRPVNDGLESRCSLLLIHAGP